ncbi:hypothetical protein ACQR1W_12580 [Bradyrhizobium sp. HKCCYLS1011]|uniref:hypothetical protein n=1 Tax=Bradyrhizobium sp. HKCCYLS1011 TaxID=3420733 RepID=UPI003EBC4D0F
MKLKRPPYPIVVGTAGYFFVHAGHRETAVEHAIEVIGQHAARARASFAGDPVMAALEQPMEAWVVESLIQGAWLREYHEWEKATKSFFDGQHQLNGGPKPDWKAKIRSASGAISHVDRVRSQLSLFGASVAEAVLETIDSQRRLINAAKHEDEYLATERDYRALAEAIADFWNELAEQEEFAV